MFTDDNQIANGICPSPTGEVRWGLMPSGLFPFSAIILAVYHGFCIKNHQPNHLLSKMESPALSNLRNTQTGIIENFPSRAYINIM